MPILMMVSKFNDIPDGKHVIAFHLLESDLNKIRFVAIIGRNVLIYLYLKEILKFFCLGIPYSDVK